MHFSLSVYLFTCQTIIYIYENTYMHISDLLQMNFYLPVYLLTYLTIIYISESKYMPMSDLPCMNFSLSVYLLTFLTIIYVTENTHIHIQTFFLSLCSRLLLLTPLKTSLAGEILQSSRSGGCQTLYPLCPLFDG